MELVGTVINEYKLEEKLGSGGFGSVFKVKKNGNL
jgi:hypothetical protein